MKKLSVFHGSAGNIIGCLLIAVVTFHPASAPAQNVTTIKNQILQNKTDELEVRLHTAAVVIQIQSLIDELAANGISGDDIKVLNTTKAVLSNLSSKEMERVIASLQKAGETPGTKTGQQSVVDAYAGQKGIILQFRQILKEYEQRQAAYELPVRFKELTDRQTETMRTTGAVAATAAGKNQNELSTMQQTTEQIVQADQEALGNEVALAVQQLDKAVQGSTGDEGKALQQAQQDLKGGQLQKALDQANDNLKAGQLLKALNAQTVARDELRRVTKDLNPPTTAVDALMATAADLAKLIEEQKNLLDQTNAAVDVKPRVIGLDEKQGILVDETNLMQQDLQSLSPTASGLVKDAINPMQDSRAELKGAGFTKAATSQQETIAKLEEAQKQLQQQIADAQKAAEDAAKNPVAALQDLQKQIQADMQQQQQVTKQTDQAANASPPDPDATAKAQQQQSQLQQQTSAMEQTAQPLSLPASQALATAADQMNQAQQAMADPATAANAPAAQQAAQAALAQANQAVAQQIAQAQQQTADPAALAAAANDLQKAQDAVSSAIADTAPAADGTTPAATPPAAAPSMADAQAALAAAAQDTQAAAATPGLPDAAAAAVADAKADIGKGEEAAAKGDAPDTAAAAAAAEGALAQAQASVALAQAGMQTPGPPMAGEPPGPPGPPMPGMPGMTPEPPHPDAPSTDGAKIVSGGSTDKGKLHNALGTGKFVTVASRDRAAIDQTQAEKRPQEYAPMIDQYMKNLADQSSSSP